MEGDAGTSGEPAPGARSDQFSGSRPRGVESFPTIGGEASRKPVDAWGKRTSFRKELTKKPSSSKKAPSGGSQPTGRVPEPTLGFGQRSFLDQLG